MTRWTGGFEIKGLVDGDPREIAHRNMSDTKAENKIETLHKAVDEMVDSLTPDNVEEKRPELRELFQKLSEFRLIVVAKPMIDKSMAVMTTEVVNLLSLIPDREEAVLLFRQHMALLVALGHGLDLDGLLFRIENDAIEQNITNFMKSYDARRQHVHDEIDSFVDEQIEKEIGKQ